MTTPADPKEVKRVKASVERAHLKAILTVPEFEALEAAYKPESEYAPDEESS